MPQFRPWSADAASTQPATDTRNINARLTAGLSLCYACCTLSHTATPSGRFSAYDATVASIQPAQDHTTATPADSVADTLADLIVMDVKEADVSTLPALNALLSGRYRCIRRLGRGSFAVTVEAEDMYHPLRRRVAVKIVAEDLAIVGVEEAKKLYRLNAHDIYDHHHVVRLLTTFIFRRHFCLVFELLEARGWDTEALLLPHERIGRRLHRMGNGVVTAAIPYLLVEPKPPPVPDRKERAAMKVDSLRKIACQLFAALNFLRQHRLLHADLKPENILFRKGDSMHLKLIDFGNAFSLDEARLYFDQFQVQSLFYRAPEVLLGIPFDCAIDTWSAGVVLCEAWLGRPLFASNTVHGMLQQIVALLGPVPASVYSEGKFYDAVYSAHPSGTTFNLADDVENLRYRVRQLSEALDTRDVHFVNFICELLLLDPKRRLTPEQALRHPFLLKLFPFTSLSSSSPSPLPAGLSHDSPMALVQLDNSTAFSPRKRTRISSAAALATPVPALAKQQQLR